MEELNSLVKSISDGKLQKAREDLKSALIEIVKNKNEDAVKIADQEINNNS